MWFFYEGDFVSYFICLVLLVFFSIPLFRLCLMLTKKDRENVSVCVFVFVWFVYLLILLIYFFYLVFFFGISLVTPLCTLHPSAPLALNSFFLVYFFISQFSDFYLCVVCFILFKIFFHSKRQNTNTNARTFTYKYSFLVLLLVIYGHV